MDINTLPQLMAKHKTFADSYLVCGNASQAARDAGYTGTGIGVTANRILKRPDVQAYLAARAAELHAEEEDLQSKIVAELKDMAFFNQQSITRVDDEGLPHLDLSNADAKTFKALTGLQTKKRKIYNAKGEHIATEETSRVSLADKYRGLELLGKHVGMFKEAEQRVVIDVADRLLQARQRLRTIEQSGGEAE